MSFPTTYAEKVLPLDFSIGQRGNASLAHLWEKGFRVATGLTPYYAGAVGIMGQQPHIAEYCPRDQLISRFATEATTGIWLTKGGGRAVFLLLEQLRDKGKLVGERLAGYAWTGVEACEQLPNHPITSAYRLGQSALGRGLSGDFVQAVVSATHELYTDEGIGLETWKSNAAARMYPKVGFVLVHESAPEPRTTLVMPNEQNGVAADGTIMDARLYMAYDMDLL